MTNENENVKIFGIKPIKEMDRKELIEELIEEIIEVNREKLALMGLPELRANVAQLRLTDYKERLLKDAGLTEGPMGIMILDDDE